MNLADLKIIVTGGAQGMGAHFATRLAEAGAQVAIGDVNGEGLKAVVAASEGLPGKIHARVLDVSDEAQCASFVAWASEAMGGLNGLVNNAGILRDGLLVKKDRVTGEIKKLTKAQWDAVIAVNLTGATLMVRETVAAMWAIGRRCAAIDSARASSTCCRQAPKWVPSSLPPSPLAIDGGVKPHPVDGPSHGELDETWAMQGRLQCTSSASFSKPPRK